MVFSGLPFMIILCFSILEKFNYSFFEQILSAVLEFGFGCYRVILFIGGWIDYKWIDYEVTGSFTGKCVFVLRIVSTLIHSFLVVRFYFESAPAFSAYVILGSFRWSSIEVRVNHRASSFAKVPAIPLKGLFSEFVSDFFGVVFHCVLKAGCS